MKVRVFYPNKDNKIEFTKQQLEKLLDEVYEEGRAKGYDQGYAANRPVTITYPYTPYWYTTTTTNCEPYITCTDNSITLATTPNSTVTTANTNVKPVSLNDIMGTITIGDEK